jgi:hypothetical protein
MKALFIHFIILLLVLNSDAQTNNTVSAKNVVANSNQVQTVSNTTDVKTPTVDKSPMDLSYYPDQYPLKKFQGKTKIPLMCRVLYGRPQKDGRNIFGDLIKYNEIWRLGANESTEIEFYKNVKIGGKAIVKGKYTLYCLPKDSTSWTFIINKDTDNWGAFLYDQKKDAVRVTVKPEKLATKIEVFSIYFSETKLGAKLHVSWDDYTAAFEINN